MNNNELFRHVPRKILTIQILVLSAVLLTGITISLVLISCNGNPGTVIDRIAGTEPEGSYCHTYSAAWAISGSLLDAEQLGDAHRYLGSYGNIKTTVAILKGDNEYSLEYAHSWIGQLSYDYVDFRCMLSISGRNFSHLLPVTRCEPIAVNRWRVTALESGFGSYDALIFEIGKIAGMDGYYILGGRYVKKEVFGYWIYRNGIDA